MGVTVRGAGAGFAESEWSEASRSANEKKAYVYGHI